MKKIILIIALVFYFFGYSQEKEFTLTKEGFTDFIITECEGKTQSELYGKTLNWINVNYKNPSSVILSKIENEYIRIEGSSFGLVTLNALFNVPKNTKYSVEISFKEGRYKFDLISLNVYDDPSQYSSGGWFPITFNKPELLFNKNEDLKSKFKYYIQIPKYFNDLNESLKNFILNKSLPSKADKW